MGTLKSGFSGDRLKSSSHLLKGSVSKSALWEVFEVYGRVVDVYIGSSKDWRRERGITFAFVRYKTSSEMLTVIHSGNNRLVDGWHLRVKKAIFGWKDRRKIEKKTIAHIDNSFSGGAKGLKGPSSYRDQRSYRDVVVENTRSWANMEGRHDALLPEGIVDIKKDFPSGDVKVLLFDSPLPQDEMEWLERCAVGQLRSP
ncbi:hypothetical protein DITRI_Ditri14bG0150900 [Diplodiscus trichospermus]